MSLNVILVGGLGEDLPQLRQDFYRRTRLHSEVDEFDLRVFGWTDRVAIGSALANLNGRVAAIGHSWGADTLAHLLARNPGPTVDLLITLDGVSRTGPPSRIHRVIRWLNVYVDLDNLTQSNVVAAIGGHWGAVKAADTNVDLGKNAAHNNRFAMLNAWDVREAMWEVEHCSVNPAWCRRPKS